VKLERKFLTQVCRLIETYTELALARRHDEEKIAELGRLLAKAADIACELAGVKVNCTGGTCRIEQKNAHGENEQAGVEK